MSVNKQENTPLLTSSLTQSKYDVDQSNTGKQDSQPIKDSNQENTQDKHNSQRANVSNQDNVPSTNSGSHGGNNNNPSKNDQLLQVYKKRWYILFLTSVTVFLQNYLVNTWPLIAVSIRPLFGWSNATISLMQNWFAVMFLVFILPFSWLLEAKGIRLSMVLTAGYMFVGTIIRCISFSPPAVTWLNNIGDIFVGLAQPIAYIVGPIISAVWFPPKERATTTSVIMSAGYLGYAVCFLIDLGIIKAEILHGRILECIVAGLLFLAILIYFPNQPPKPPSKSSALPKFDFVKGLKSLFIASNANFWLICATNAVMSGIYCTWLSLITINLSHFMAQKQIGYLGAIASLLGPVAALIIGRLGDVFSEKRKTILLLCACLAVFSTFWILLLSMSYIQFSAVQLYIAIILQAIAIEGPCGLMIEMAVESNYPIDETVTSLAVSIGYNVLVIPFLLVFLIPNIGTSWMNWFLYMSMIVCIPLVYFFDDRNRRLAVDRRESLVLTVGSRTPQTIVTNVD